MINSEIVNKIKSVSDFIVDCYPIRYSDIDVIYRVIFQHPDKTFTNLEIDEMLKEIKDLCIY